MTSSSRRQVQLVLVRPVRLLAATTTSSSRDVDRESWLLSVLEVESDEPTYKARQPARQRSVLGV